MSGYFTEGPSQNSKTLTEGPSQNSKTLELWLSLLDITTENLRDYSDDPGRYLLARDLAERLGRSQSTLSYHLAELLSRGLIKVDRNKTNLYRSYKMHNGTVYIPTSEGAELYRRFHGGAFPKFEKFTGGPRRPALDNLHGDLVIRYDIKSGPATETVEWDRENTLRNGVEHKIKQIEGAEGQKATIELFKGRERTTATLKPRLTGTSTDNLLDKLNKLAWGIYKDFKKNGYEVGLPQQTGEGKFTIVSEDLPDHMEGENFLVDQSRGKPELHPRTGDLETNAEMAKMLTETGYMAEASKKIDRVEAKVDMQAKVITRLTDTVSNLVDQLGAVGDQIESYEPPSGGPGEAMYG